MPARTDPLSQLRDIHLPEGVGFWPPAPGWWLLALIILGAIAAVVYRLWRHYRRNRYRRLALRQLQALASQSDKAAYLQGLNRLLKQTALAAPQTPPVAGLTGSRWLAFLDRSGDTDAFSRGPGRLLQQGPYAPEPVSDDRAELEALHRLAARWIRRHRFQGKEVAC